MEMELKQIDILTTAEVMDGHEYIFDMSVLRRNHHREGFRFWIHDLGHSDAAGDHIMRFKADNGDNETAVILILPQDDSPVYIDMQHTDKEALQKFPYRDEVMQFMEEFRDLLRMQWNGTISADAFKDIVKLVRIKRVSPDAAVNTVLYENVYKDIYDTLCDIADVSEYWRESVRSVCNSCGTEHIKADADMVAFARKLLEITPESDWESAGIKNCRNALTADINGIDKLTE